MTTSGRHFRKKPADLAGRRFTLLTAVRLLGRKNGKWEWECRCDCGRTCHVAAHHLMGESTRSCGCLRHRKVPTGAGKSSRASGSGVIAGPTYRHLLAREEMQISNVNLGEAKLSVYRQFHRKSA